MGIKPQGFKGVQLRSFIPSCTFQLLYMVDMYANLHSLAILNPGGIFVIAR